MSNLGSRSCNCRNYPCQSVIAQGNYTKIHRMQMKNQIYSFLIWLVFSLRSREILICNCRGRIYLVPSFSGILAFLSVGTVTRTRVQNVDITKPATKNVSLAPKLAMKNGMRMAPATVRDASENIETQWSSTKHLFVSDVLKIGGI